MQREKKGVFALVLLCIIFLLSAYVYVSPRLVLVKRQELESVKTQELESQRDTRTHPCGFVVVRRYSGQQGAGVKALTSVQRWIKDVRLPMMIVEPFLQNSVVGVHRRRRGQEEGAKFSDMFDMDSFNAASRSKGLPEMVAWSDYIASAPRQAVSLDMMAISKTEDFQPPSIQPPSIQPPSIQPPSIQPTAGMECRVIAITAPDGTTVSLCEVRRVMAPWKFANTHTLSEEDVYGTILRGLDPTNVTLIFSLWRGPWGVDTVATAALQAIPNGTTDNDTSADLDYMFQDSPKLHHSMEIYQNKFLTAPGERESRYVAVMIRAEHSVLQFQVERSSNISARLENCLHQLQDKTDEAMRSVGTDKLLVTGDVGYYGSGTWHDTVSNPQKGNVTDIQCRVKRGVERLYEGGERWSFEQWEQSFIEASGGITDRGYVAALQRVLATSSQAACLVLMGGGLFQSLSLENYLHHTRHQAHTRCIHLVCMQRKYVESFTSMLTRAGE